MDGRIDGWMEDGCTHGWMGSVLAKVSITKFYRLGGLNSRI